MKKEIFIKITLFHESDMQIYTGEYSRPHTKCIIGFKPLFISYL